MAELDLYGDLYGDVDDSGSQVALSPSQAIAPVVEAPTTSSSAPAAVIAKSEPDALPPTTFSIATYEDPAYANKKPDVNLPPGADSNWHPPPQSTGQPLTPALSSPASSGPNGRPGLWGVKPSDMPDEGSVSLIIASFSPLRCRPLFHPSTVRARRRSDVDLARESKHCTLHRVFFFSYPVS